MKCMAKSKDLVASHFKGLLNKVSYFHADEITRWDILG